MDQRKKSALSVDFLVLMSTTLTLPPSTTVGDLVALVGVGGSGSTGSLAISVGSWTLFGNGDSFNTPEYAWALATQAMIDASKAGTLTVTGFATFPATVLVFKRAVSFGYGGSIHGANSPVLTLPGFTKQPRSGLLVAQNHHINNNATGPLTAPPFMTPVHYTQYSTTATQGVWIAPPDLYTSGAPMSFDGHVPNAWNNASCWEVIV